jgi:ABC-type amino acid transport substrate-binding protein
MQSMLRAIYLIIFIFIAGCGNPSKNVEPELSSKNTDPFALSSEEKTWLVSHPNIKLAPDPDYIPIEYFDENGNYKGIAADYLALIQEKLGIKFNIVRLKDWEEIIAQTKAGKVDMWGAARTTPQRLNYMMFTKSYIKIPAGIFVTKEVQGSIKVSQLDGEKVSIPSGYATQDYIENNYPNIKLDLVPNSSAALQRVSSGKSKAFIGNVVLASYYIQQEGIKNLRIASQPGINYEWGFATRKDWPILNRILEKTIDSIKADEEG